MMEPMKTFPSLRIYTLGPFLVERRRDDGTWKQIEPGLWRKYTYARLLLQRLLCSGRRRVERSTLIEDLWPSATSDAVERYPSDAAYCLRHKILGMPEVVTLFGNQSGYQLASQQQVWVDADACLDLLDQVEQREWTGQNSSDLLSCLEQAVSLFSRGGFLEEQTGQWAYAQRAVLERAQYRGRLWLALAYEQLGMVGRAERQYSRLLEETPQDETLIGHFLSFLLRQGMKRQAHHWYEAMKSHFEDLGIPLSSEIQGSARYLLNLPFSRRTPHQASFSQWIDERGPLALPASLNGTGFLPPESIFSPRGTWLASRYIRSETLNASPQRILPEPISTFSQPLAKSHALFPYERHLRAALHLHLTSHAQQFLQDIDRDQQELETLEEQVEGEYLIRVRTFLLANGLLATKIVKDSKHYALAYAYANYTVRLAKSLEDEGLLATTRYTRGCTKLEWGLFETIRQGRFSPDHQKIEDAIRDFESILALAHRKPDLLHRQLQGLTHLQLSRAHAFLLPEGPSESQRRQTVLLAEQAAEMVGYDPIDDPYQRLLVTGTLSGLHQGGYHLVKAGIFNQAGLPDAALRELEHLARLRSQTYGQDETRNQAWKDITTAEAFLGLHDYKEAARKARSALVACYHIRSHQNAMMITDLYSRLVLSDHRQSTDVQALGDLLHEWYGQEQHTPSV